MSISSLPNLIGENGIFVDGDWVESKDQDPNGDVRLIQLADIGDSEYLDKSSRFLTSKKATELRCTYLMPGDILVARMPDPIGRACIFPGDSKACVTVVDVCIVRPDPKIVDSKWLLHKINSLEFRHLISTYATGTTRKRISRRNLGKLTFELPPLAEQKRIAAILDKADALRAKRRAALAKLDTLLQATFLHMFGDPVTNPMGWEVFGLGDFLTFLTSGSRGWAKYYSENGTRFIRSLDVRMNYISDEDTVYVNAPESAEAKRTRVQYNDVLLTITGSRIGRVATVSKDIGEANISQHVAILRLDQSKIRPRFVSIFLSLTKGGQRQIKNSAYGQTKPGLNFKQIRSFRIPNPPLKHQDRFLEYWDKVNCQAQKTHESSVQLDNLFHALQQRAFKGDL